MICNACHREMPDGTVHTLTEGEYEVQYLHCGKCGATYQVLTTDAESRDLVARRRDLAHKIDLGRQKHFTEKTLKKYQKESDKIKKRQMKLAHKLRDVGDTILHDHI